MSSSVFRCNICNKEYRYQKSYLTHCKGHVQPQQGQLSIQQPTPAYNPLPTYNPMGWNNFQLQYPVQEYPVQEYPMGSYQFLLPMEVQPYPYQYAVPLQLQQYNLPSYYPSYWPTNNPTHQADNYEYKDMEISQTNNSEDMDIPNSLNEQQDQVTDDPKYYIINSAFKNNIITYGIPIIKDCLLLEDVVKENRAVIKERLENSLGVHNIIKFNITLIGEYIKITSEDMELCTISHRSKMNLLCLGDDVEELITKQLQEIENKMSDFQERDSGWTLIRIARLEISVNKSSLVRGSNWISTPEKLKNKSACINVENNDIFCFKWALISALDTCVVKRRQRCCSYNITDISSDIIHLQNGVEIDFKNLNFPLTLKSIKIFEERNPDISVNVFGYNNESDEIVGPYYITKEERHSHVNLLLLENTEGYHHYIFIKHISKLLKSQTTKHHTKLLFCNSCLQYTHNGRTMEQHKLECGKIVSELPSEDESILYFKDHQRQMDVPFVIYADFECILEDSNIRVSGKSSYTKKHIPCAFSYYIKCSHDDRLDKFKLYTGKDAAEKFVDSIINDSEDIYNSYLTNKSQMDALTPFENFNFQHATNCHICHKYLGGDRVRDHCHISGKFRGAAHNICNLKFQIPKFIPIYFHNYSSYDSHLFVKELAKRSDNIKVLPLNKELYISLSRFSHMTDNYNLELRFLDTIRFMSESLESLANNLSEQDFFIVQTQFKTKKEFDLVRRKGIFPYEFLNSFEKLNVSQLPAREDFFNHLNNKECSIEDYEHAKEVWNAFSCKTLQDYMEVYLKTDVLLLADIFENFRKVCKNIYHLDPCQYFTAPGLSWDAMLKYTNVELELLTDIDMYNFFKKGIRGGLVQCSKRYSKANNKYLQDFDREKPSEYIVYLDANNLYGWAMSEYLPYGGFRWLSTDQLNLDPKTIDDSSSDGYVYEVTLDYPYNLHDLHNDLPFCPENKKIPQTKHTKLIADFSTKQTYVIHYRVLKQCLKYGLVLKNVHRILTFKQSTWLKSYIDLNTKHRATAKNAFEKNFFKLLNNAVYGKTMENVEKRKDVRIVTKWNRTNRNQLGAQDWICKPNFHSLSIFSEDMVAIEMNRLKTYYNKPIYLGFCVLELSKWKMYDFHYGYMQPKFKSKLSLNYMDTDSFIYNIKTEDFYHDIKTDLDQKFDTSDYPQDNTYGLPLVNKKVLGMMKDENCGKVMKEFVGLRSKMYSFSVQYQNDIKKSKGVKKCVLDMYSISSYRNCLFDKSIVYDTMLTFKSKLHQIYTNHLSKVVLSYSDDKRKIDSNSINTFAWNHFRIEETNPDYELDMLLAEIAKLQEADLN